MTAEVALRVVKITHTVIWAFFCSCIFAIPIFAWRANYRAAFILIAIVFLEVAVLAANGFICPLTNIARRYTNDRRENFDIYLPRWLARSNKQIFGAIFSAGALFTVLRWLL